MIYTIEAMTTPTIRPTNLQDFQLDENSDIPLWAQLKKRLTYLIMTHTYAKGDQLPTVRELSSTLGVAYNTVSKVYRDLERDGLIRTKQGSGTFVTHEGDSNDSSPDAAVEALAVKLIEESRNVGMTNKEVISLVKKYLERIDQ